MRYDSSTPLLRTAAFCAAVLTLLLFAGRVTAAAADTAWLSLQGAQNPSGSCPYSITFNAWITGPGNSSVTYYFTRFAGKAVSSTPVTITIPASGTTQGTSLIPPSQITVDSSTVGLQSYELDIQSPAGSDTTTHGKIYFNAKCGLLLSTMPPIPVATPTFSMKNAVSHGPIVSTAIVALHPGASAMRSKVLLNQGQADFFFGSCTHAQILCAGYDHVLDTGVFGEKKAGIYRSYVMFPNIPHGTNVVKALLGLHQIFNGTDATSFQCFGGVAPAIAPWTSNNNFVDGDFGFPAPAQYIGPDATVDVTSIVKAWASGKLVNNGFVLRGSDESTFIGADGDCHYLFSPIELRITTQSPILMPQ